jgi:WD40 repeat protein
MMSRRGVGVVLGGLVLGSAALLPGAAPPAQSTDRYGDPLPRRVVARLGTLRHRNLDSWARSAFSPDGKWLASGERYGPIRLLDPRTGRELRRIGPADHNASAVLFTPDGRTLASVRDALYLWDPRTGKSVRRLAVPPRNLGVLAFSSDGKRLATGDEDSTVRLWEVNTGKLTRELEGENGPVAFLAFLPGNRSLVAGYRDHTVAGWNVATGKRTYEVCHEDEEGAGAPVIALSADGRTLALLSGRGSKNTTVYLLNPATGKEVRRLTGVYGRLDSLASSPDGRLLAAGGRDGKLHLWRAATGEVVRRIDNGPGLPVSGLHFLDNKTIVSAAGNAHRLWDVVTGREVQPRAGHQNGILAVAFSPDGRRVISTARDGTLRVWDARTGKELRRFEGPGHSASDLVLSANGRVALSWGELHLGKPAPPGPARLWDLGTGKPMPRPDKPPDRVLLPALCPDGKAAACLGNYRKIHVWDLDTGKSLGTVVPPAPEPSGRGRWRRDFSTGQVAELAVAPGGGHLATGGMGRPLGLWETAGGRTCWELALAGEHVSCLTFSPDGRTLAMRSSEGRLYLVEAATGQERARLSATDRGTALAFSPDGRALALASWEGIRLWDLTSGAQRAHLVGHEGGWVNCVAFSPDGRRLVSGADDTTVLIWDVSKLLRPRGAPARKMARAERAARWADLGAEDARRADRASWALAQAAEGVAFVGQQVRPAAVPSAARVTRLLADLDDEQFEVREKASDELDLLGEMVEADLRRHLRGKPSLEVRRRVERLLEGLQRNRLRPAGEPLRALRALEVLERAGTAPAVRLLRALAGGAPVARLTREAKSALRRLKRRGRRP